jgi:hypothetical protein|tara:strand:- start:228 stop:770 length:543 start_codon:yes stop_codon:yes gene_type:complete
MATQSMTQSEVRRRPKRRSGGNRSSSGEQLSTSSTSALIARDGSEIETTMGNFIKSCPILQEDRLHERAGRRAVLGMFRAIEQEQIEAQLPPPRIDPYYWDDTFDGDAVMTPLKHKMYDFGRWMANTCWGGVRFAGEVLVEFFGLNRSHYQSIVDQIERENAMKKQRKLLSRQVSFYFYR